MLKLGIRLKQIEALVAPDYHHIWDCCCDHGLLGTSLLQKQIAPHIHFVDIVPELITSLTQKLEIHFPQIQNQSQRKNKRSQWHTHCLDISQLPLDTDLHLVIIAGIGGELMAQCVKDITTKHPNLAIDFLLCPVHHIYTLREQLIALNMGLQKEVLIKENNRYYEILYVSNQVANAKIRTKTKAKIENIRLKNISIVGEELWGTDEINKKENAQNYLKKTLEHYLRIQAGIHKANDLKANHLKANHLKTNHLKIDQKAEQNIRVDHIIKAYQDIADKL